jgi:hypothetical protein
MGLYLCVFDENDDELEGLEIGSYADFGFFRETVVATVEKGRAGSVCPVLINHADSDGHWTPLEAAALLEELEKIETVLKEYPPVAFNSPWKEEVAKTFGITPGSLLDCFFDVDGEPLTQRLKQLAAVSVGRKLSILFQ